MSEPVEQRVTRLHAPDEQTAMAGIPDGVFEAAARAWVGDDLPGADVRNDFAAMAARPRLRAIVDTVWLLATAQEREALLADMAATFRDVYPGPVGAAPRQGVGHCGGVRGRPGEEPGTTRRVAATPGPWSPDPTGTVCADADLVPDGAGGELLPPDGPMEVAECYRNECPDERGLNAEHIARHDPARVLREVEAKRRIIAEVERWVHFYLDDDSWYSCGLAIGYDETEPGSGCDDEDRRGQCDCGLDARRLCVLAPLATVYDQHPDYRAEWAT